MPSLLYWHAMLHTGCELLLLIVAKNCFSVTNFGTSGNFSTFRQYIVTNVVYISRLNPPVSRVFTPSDVQGCVKLPPAVSRVVWRLRKFQQLYPIGLTLFTNLL